MIYEREIKRRYLISGALLTTLGIFMWFGARSGEVSNPQLLPIIILGFILIMAKPDKMKRLSEAERKAVLAKYQYPVWVWALTVIPGVLAGLYAYHTGFGFHAVMAGCGIFMLAQGLATLAYVLFFMSKGDLPDIDPAL